MEKTIVTTFLIVQGPNQEKMNMDQNCTDLKVQGPSNLPNILRSLEGSKRKQSKNGTVKERDSSILDYDPKEPLKKLTAFPPPAKLDFDIGT